MGSIRVNERIEQIAKNADLRRVNTPGKDNTPLQGKNTPQTSTKRLQGIADTNAKLREQSKAILTEYSENRRQAGTLRKEIAKGSSEGVDLDILFEKAIKCIECMTGDTAFYTTVIGNIKKTKL